MKILSIFLIVLGCSGMLALIFCSHIIPSAYTPIMAVMIILSIGGGLGLWLRNRGK